MIDTWSMLIQTQGNILEQTSISSLKSTPRKMSGKRPLLNQAKGKTTANYFLTSHTQVYRRILVMWRSSTEEHQEIWTRNARRTITYVLAAYMSCYRVTVDESRKESPPWHAMYGAHDKKHVYSTLAKLLKQRNPFQHEKEGSRMLQIHCHIASYVNPIFVRTIWDGNTSDTLHHFTCLQFVIKEWWYLTAEPIAKL